MTSPQWRILCVEDHPETRDLLKLLFNLQGYEVAFATTLAEGLRLAQSERFDLFLLDNWLPDGMGIELCRQIREFDHETPIVFYSLWDTKADRQRGLEAGAQAYVGKLRDSEALVQTIARLIEERAARGTSTRA